MGRAEIARATALTTQAISNIIAELEQDGLLEPKGRLSKGRGLPAKQYGVAADGGFALGIEVRPDAVFSTLLDLHGVARHTNRAALDDSSPQAVVARVAHLRGTALKAVTVARDRVLGTGVVMPGPFGATGLSATTSELTGWDDIDPARLFSDVLGGPVEVQNDANAAALAERMRPAEQGLHSYALIYFGAGLGLGLVSQAGWFRARSAMRAKWAICPSTWTIDGFRLKAWPVVCRFRII